MDHYLWNYKDNLDRIRGICDSWLNRDLSIKGKISVVNSLLVSLLQYVASNSELPRQVHFELKKIITHFIWNKHRAKIAYATLIQDVGGGGLRLADLELRATVAKLGWIRCLVRNPDSFSAHFLTLLSGGIHPQCLIYGKVGSLPGRFGASLFYSDVFRHWLALHGSPPTSEEEIRGEILWHNKRITMDGLPFCWREWMERGIWRVGDLLEPGEGRFLSHEELNLRFGVGASFLHTFQVRQSIPVAWRRLLTPQGKSHEGTALSFAIGETQSSDIMVASPRKLYAELLLGRRQTPRAQTKWETDFRDSTLLDEWDLIYRSPFKAVRETKLQSLQYKIFHRTIPCRRYLSTIRVVESDKCQFCPEVDTIRHFLLDCPYSKRLWNMIADWSWRTNGPDIASLSPEEILLGAVLPTKTAPMLNYISLFTKAFIHRQKLFFNGDMGLIGWLGELKKKLLMEECICRSEGRAQSFARWRSVLQALG